LLGQQRAVGPLPGAVPVGVDDREPALQPEPLAAGQRAARQGPHRHRPVHHRGQPLTPPLGGLAGPARDRGDGQDQDHDRDRQPGRDVHSPLDAVVVQGLQDQLGADERAHHGQPGVQVHQPVQHPDQQHVQVPQAHQREHVGRHDQHRLGGDAEDGRDRVEGEQHVGHRDGPDQQHHGRHHVVAGRATAVHAAGAGPGEPPLQVPHHAARLLLGRAVGPSAQQAERGPE
jgi:hypothetical protein